MSRQTEVENARHGLYCGQEQGRGGHEPNRMGQIGWREGEGRPLFTSSRIIAAVAVALLGCVAVWILTPYNNFILRNGLISDNFLPQSVLAVILVLVLVVNPLLRLVRPRWALDFKQMALITAIMLVACQITSQGLLRILPYSLAVQTRDASEWKEYAEYYEEADLPPSLFPGELGYHAEVDAAKQLLVKLPPGESIPWDAWAGPALSWGCFLIFFWMMAISLAGIMLPQWQRNERMPMPLTRILQSILETPEEGRLLAPLFRNRWFWIAAAAIFALHLLAGLSLYYPERVPSIGTAWNLSGLFSEAPLTYMPDYMRSGRIHFIFLGVAYFMATRVSFSIWFFMLLYAFLDMTWEMYAPPFPEGAPITHRTGAMLAVTCFILWLSRERWLKVFRCLFLGDGGTGTSAGGTGTSAGGSGSGPRGVDAGEGAKEVHESSKGTWLRLGLVLLGVTVALVLVAQFLSVWAAVGLVAAVLVASLIRRLHSDESRRDRHFAFMFFVGGLGMFAWLVWAGVQAPWAFLLVGIAAMYQLVVTRILAETGLPLMGLYETHFWHIFYFVPIKFVNATTAWFIGSQSVMHGMGSRVSLSALAMQSMSLDEEAGPRHQWRLGRTLVAVLVLGFVVSGAAHLYFSYNHSHTLDRNPEVPISSWGSGQLWQAIHLVQMQGRGEWEGATYNQPLHVALGAAVASGLQYACLTMPRWPLHPVGLLLAYSWYGQSVWMSVLFGWLARVTILLFGGARLFRKLRPLFIGLIMGELIAIVFWAGVAALVAFSGNLYYVVPILPD